MRLIQGRPAAGDPAEPEAPAPAARSPGDISLRKLQVFWAVAHTHSLTKSAKMLGVSQPSLSQQLGALEATLGGRLFDRLSNTMVPTELGAALLPKAEDVLRAMQEFEDSLPRADGALRMTVRVAGVTSVMRMLLPNALREARLAHPTLDFDMHEAAPAEILDLLYGRRIHMGLIADNSVAEAGAGFHREPLAVDPYVLAVPEALDLGAVAQPARDLAPEARDLLSSIVRFEFGTHHSRRIEDWFDRVLPGHRVTAKARSFELALEMVRSGLGVCVAPSLSALSGAGQLDGIRLYHTDLDPRRIVAMLPAQSRRLAPYPDLLASLGTAVAALPRLRILPMPPFVARAAAAGRAADSVGL